MWENLKGAVRGSGITGISATRHTKEANPVLSIRLPSPPSCHRTGTLTISIYVSSRSEQNYFASQRVLAQSGKGEGAWAGKTAWTWPTEEESGWWKGWRSWRGSRRDSLQRCHCLRFARNVLEEEKHGTTF